MDIYDIDYTKVVEITDMQYVGGQHYFEINFCNKEIEDLTVHSPYVFIVYQLHELAIKLFKESKDVSRL